MADRTASTAKATPWLTQSEPPIEGAASSGATAAARTPTSAIKSAARAATTTGFLRRRFVVDFSDGPDNGGLIRGGDKSKRLELKETALNPRPQSGAIEAGQRR